MGSGERPTVQADAAATRCAPWPKSVPDVPKASGRLGRAQQGAAPPSRCVIDLSEIDAGPFNSDPNHTGRDAGCVRRLRRIFKVYKAHPRRVPSHVAIQHDPHVCAFYRKLSADGKTSTVDLAAVMRKRLYAIYGMLKHRTACDSAKIYQIPAAIP